MPDLFLPRVGCACTLFCLFAPSAPAQLDWPLPTGLPSYTIVYSGRFFGYFRSPDIQSTADVGCPAGESSPAAELYLSKPPTSGQLRVALGDNFAPELLARKMLDLHLPQPVFRGRDLFTPIPGPPPSPVSWYSVYPHQPAPSSGFRPLHGTIPSDSVGCFLKKAAFEAIVPGPNDFYFGAERVSQIARFLAAPSGSLPPLQMLGANIVVSTTRSGQGKPLPQDQLPPDIRTVLKAPKLNPPTATPVNIDLPSDVLPWLRSFSLVFPEPSSARPTVGFLCPADSQDPNDFSFPAYDKKAHQFAAHGCLQLLQGPPNPSGLKLDFTLPRISQSRFDFSLTPNANYAFCAAIIDPPASVPGPSTKIFCKPFTVRQPLFQVSQVPDGQNGDPLSPAACISNGFYPSTSLPMPCHIDPASPLPYCLHDRPGQPVIAVFGIVGNGLTAQVGLLNSSWRNSYDSGFPLHHAVFDTAVKIVDPAVALLQMIDLCNRDETCRTAHKIVLAQMSPDEARSAIASVLEVSKETIFDAVITRPEAAAATGNTLLSQLEESSSDSSQKPFVIVPGYQYDPPKSAGAVRFQSADLYLSRPTKQGKVDVLRNHLAELQVPQASGTDAAFINAKLTYFENAVTGQIPSPAKPFTQRYELPALRAMQRYCQSDFAVLQPRDIFYDYRYAILRWRWRTAPYQAPNGQAVDTNQLLFSPDNFLDEILWKGDFAICQPITGASLKSALAASAQRGSSSGTLDLLGVEPDPDHDSFLIHGAPLDEQRLYSMATSDFLAFSNTQYPDLASPDLPPPASIRSIHSLIPIATLTAEGILPNPSLNRGLVQTLHAKDYLDSIVAATPDATSGFDWRAQTIDWLKHWVLPNPFAPTALAKSPPLGLDRYRADAQHRPLTFFNLEKLDVTYNFTSINGPQQLVASHFSGITGVPQLQATEAQSIAVWNRIRVGHEFSRLDWFGTAETRYGFSRLRNEAAAPYDPYTISITDNTFTFESGLLTKRLSNHNPLRLLLAERISTQIREPLLSYSTPVGPGSTSPAPSNCHATSIDIAPPAPGTAGAASVLCAAPRNYLQETRLGFRIENKESWIELGALVGHNFNSITGYTFNQGSPAQVNCSARTDLSLSGCIQQLGTAQVNQFSPLSVGHQTLPIYGGFLNFKYSVPLDAPKLQLDFEGYSEFFAKNHRDNTTDTRFYEDLIVSLPLKLFQNLTFSPQIEAFNYQNKVAPNHFLSLTGVFSLDYTFDWHSGAGHKALTYPDPSNVSKSPVHPVP